MEYHDHFKFYKAVISFVFSYEKTEWNICQSVKRVLTYWEIPYVKQHWPGQRRLSYRSTTSCLFCASATMRPPSPPGSLTGATWVLAAWCRSCKRPRAQHHEVPLVHCRTPRGGPPSGPLPPGHLVYWSIERTSNQFWWAWRPAPGHANSAILCHTQQSKQAHFILQTTPCIPNECDLYCEIACGFTSCIYLGKVWQKLRRERPGDESSNTKAIRSESKFCLLLFLFLLLTLSVCDAL